MNMEICVSMRGGDAFFIQLNTYQYSLLCMQVRFKHSYEWEVSGRKFNAADITKLAPTALGL